MGKIEEPKKVKLISGIMFSSKHDLDAAIEILKQNYGEIDLTSNIMDFNFTDYYNSEMGDNLKKIFVSFKDLISPDEIVDIKIKTNEIEDMFLYENSKNRRINIDPGYISGGNLVLATTKDYSHRIYLGKGIFAEVTLLFQDKKFHTVPWTYPDFKTNEYMDYLLEVRKKYMNELN
jgi:hypothetical protein